MQYGDDFTSTDCRVELGDDLLVELGNEPKRLRLLEWLLTDKDARSPHTITELARDLGLSRKTLYNWRDSDDFIRVWRREAVKLAGGIERTQRVLDQLFKDATQADKASERTTAGARFLAATGAITPADTTPRAETDLSKLSTVELQAMLRDALEAELRARGETNPIGRALVGVA